MLFNKPRRKGGTPEQEHILRCYLYHDDEMKLLIHVSSHYQYLDLFLDVIPKRLPSTRVSHRNIRIKSLSLITGFQKISLTKLYLVENLNTSAQNCNYQYNGIKEKLRQCSQYKFHPIMKFRFFSGYLREKVMTEPHHQILPIQHPMEKLRNCRQVKSSKWVMEGGLVRNVDKGQSLQLIQLDCETHK